MKVRLLGHRLRLRLRLRLSLRLSLSLRLRVKRLTDKGIIINKHRICLRGRGREAFRVKLTSH